MEQLLRRLCDGVRERPLSLVTEVTVFGSYARGALEPHDVDISVAHGSDDEWVADAVAAIMNGRDPYVGLRKALRGTTRSLQITFDDVGALTEDRTVLWRAGDSFEVAYGRLHAIAVDPNAGRAPRHAMLDVFEGLDRWIPRGAREVLSAADAAGAITIDRVELADARARDRDVAGLIDHRWNVRHRYRRAAHAAIAYLEDRGVRGKQVDLQNQGRHDAACAVGFDWRGWNGHPPWHLTDGKATLWVEVVHPTLTQPLNALIIATVDRDLLARVRV